VTERLRSPRRKITAAPRRAAIASAGSIPARGGRSSRGRRVALPDDVTDRQSTAAGQASVAAGAARRAGRSWIPTAFGGRRVRRAQHGAEGEASGSFGVVLPARNGGRATKAGRPL
jgi:hypothetical protein